MPTLDGLELSLVRMEQQETWLRTTSQLGREVDPGVVDGFHPSMTKTALHYGNLLIIRDSKAKFLVVYYHLV